MFAELEVPARFEGMSKSVGFSPNSQIKRHKLFSDECVIDWKVVLCIFRKWMMEKKLPSIGQFRLDKRWSVG